VPFSFPGTPQEGVTMSYIFTTAIDIILVTLNIILIAAIIGILIYLIVT
jgi:hypothetical protein